MSSSKSPFFEITIENRRGKVDSLLIGRISILNQIKADLKNKIDSTDSIVKVLEDSAKRNSGLKTQLELQKTQRTTEKTSYIKQLGLADTRLIKAQRDRSELVFLNKDTAPNFYTEYFSLDRDSLFDFLNQENLEVEGHTKRIYQAVDTATDKKYPNGRKYFTVSPVDTNGANWNNDQLYDLPKKPARAYLVKKEFQSKIAFINKYPVFGLWGVISIAQVSMWFVIAAIISSLAYNFYNKYNISIPKGQLSVIIGLVLVAMLVFFIGTSYFLIDAAVIQNHFFLEHFNMRMFIMAIFGYIVAGVCFINYLLVANEAEKINGAAVAVPQQIDDLKSLLDYSFGFSALILSVFVVWMGIMFNSINSLDLMSYYHQISKRHFLSNDFVYLIGLLHSLLLLIFYLPVRIYFGSLQKFKSTTPDTTGLPWYKSIPQGLFSKLSPVLITASPLVSGLVQHLIATLTG